jgi:hypothetical protein
MSDEAERQPESESHLSRYVLVIATTLVLYVFSVGPVAVAMVKMNGSGMVMKVFDVFYTPLDRLVRCSPVLQKGANAYVMWWFDVCGVSLPK